MREIMVDEVMKIMLRNHDFMSNNLRIMNSFHLFSVDQSSRGQKIISIIIIHYSIFLSLSHHLESPYRYV